MRIEDIREVIQKAILQKNTLKVSLFRAVLSKIEAYKHNSSRLSIDEMIMKAIRKEYKELKEELSFNKEDTPHYKAICSKLAYLDVYMPKELSEEEMYTLVHEAMLACDGMGSIMKYIKGSGKEVNMKKISEIVKGLML